MEPDAYRDARWHALLREAVQLGASEQDAPRVVDAVLARKRRRIRRADDPDPLVREALLAALRPTPPARRGRPRRGTALLVAGLAAVAAVAVVARPTAPPTRRLDADQVPSLFGFDGPSADALLTSRGLRVRLLPFRACEVQGRVIASDPPPGARVDRGDRITVYTALPADIACLTDYQQRALAWRLIDFAGGRATAPPFAPRVFVYPEPGRRLVLSGREAAEADVWRATGVLTAIQKAAGQVALIQPRPAAYAVPAVRIVPVDQGLGRCGVPSTSVTGSADAFALLLRPPGRRGCGLRVELVRDGRRRIESVALYRASP